MTAIVQTYISEPTKTKNFQSMLLDRKTAIFYQIPFFIQNHLIVIMRNRENRARLNGGWDVFVLRLRSFIVLVLDRKNSSALSNSLLSKSSHCENGKQGKQGKA